MSTTTDTKDKIDRFMQAEMPQIKMHGGDWEILSLEDGHAEILLDDACSGCGISPMTIQAIKDRMPESVEEISSVDAKTETMEMKNPTDGPF